jgi:hypothetical protein
MAFSPASGRLNKPARAPALRVLPAKLAHMGALAGSLSASEFSQEVILRR